MGRRKKCVLDVKMEQEVIDNAHRCHILIDSMTHLITKDYAKQQRVLDDLTGSKEDGLLLIDTQGQSVKYVSKNEEDEVKEAEHLSCVECDMSIVEKIRNDCHLIELLNLEITTIKTKRKEIEQRYRAYIDGAFKQFANLCVRYKKNQLTKKNSWSLGQVIVPTIVYRVRDRDKHLNKFKQNNADSHKFVQ